MAPAHRVQLFYQVLQVVQFNPFIAAPIKGAFARVQRPVEWVVAALEFRSVQLPEFESRDS